MYVAFVKTLLMLIHRSCRYYCDN